MAETAVLIVIDKLIPIVRGEAELLKGVHGEISSIKDELELIKAYIKDADEKAERADTSNLVKEWVKQVREVAYRIEDVIDEYLFKVAKRGQKHGLDGVVRKTGDLLRSIVPRHEITSEVVSIRESLVRLNQARETFGFNPSATEVGGHIQAEMSTRHDLRRGARFMEDAELVGVDETKEKLMGWLSTGESRRTIISVVGEGGLGKTTIVNNLYKKQMGERSFQCYAWITVSHSLKTEKLLQIMMQSFYEYEGNKSDAMEINKIMDKDVLTSKLREFLQEKRYMIVFDDVWDKEFWGGVEYALPENNKSNRIVITTRDRGVAEFCRRFALVYIHELDPLPPKDALKLFHLKAFQFDDFEQCPEELTGLSQDFVKKCDGVPLAIVAIAGLLSTKNKDASEWQKVHNNLHSKLTSDPHLKGYHQVLAESYNDLPYHLKLCLLYFGLFPEDYSISCTRLLNLWIIEGFIMQNANEYQTIIEEVAEEYLNELIRRSLVKISDAYPYGQVQRCRVHDLMHNFILRKCEEMNFCQMKKSEKFSFHPLTRRLSIHTNSINALQRTTTNYDRVRSCFVVNHKELPKPVIESLLSSFKLLIGLDLEDAHLDYLPKAIGNLLHLKYLNLRNTKIKAIPKFIGKLQNLEILILKGSLVQELPMEVNKLVKLRILFAYHPILTVGFNMQGVKLKEGIKALREMQRLSFIDVTDGDGVVNELRNLKQMRRLSIVKLRRHQGKLLCRSIESMKHLFLLGITAAEQHEVLDLESLNDPPQKLQRPYLDGCLEILPKWISELKNLVKMRLSYSGLQDDPLPLLKYLPQLLELHLFNSYEGEELHFESGYFRKLKNLELEDMQSLRTLKIDKGALPILEALRLNRCLKFVDVPNDIQKLDALKVIHIEEMPGEIITSLKLKEGKHYEKIKKISIVTSRSQGFYRCKLQNLS